MAPPASAAASAGAAPSAAIPAPGQQPPPSPHARLSGVSLFDRPDTAFSAGWIVPGTLAAGATGAFLGGSVAALDPSRPLFRATANAGIKCAVAGFMYFGGVTQLTALTSPAASDATGPSSSRQPVPLQSI